MTEERTQHCNCGNDTYHIKWALEVNPEIWVECTECGRPTRTVGPQIQRELNSETANPTTGEWVDELEDAEEGDTILFDEAGGNVENPTENDE